MKEKAPLVLEFTGRRMKCGKVPAKKKEKTSFWIVLLWDNECRSDGEVEMILDKYNYPAVFGKKSNAEKAGAKGCKDANKGMLHPEDLRYRYKAIELKGGKK